MLFIFWNLAVTNISSGKLRQCCQQHNKGLHPSTFQKQFRKLFRPVSIFILDCFSWERKKKKSIKHEQTIIKSHTNLFSIWEWTFCHLSANWSTFSLCQSKSRSRSLCILNIWSLIIFAFCSSSSKAWNVCLFSSTSDLHC